MRMLLCASLIPAWFALTGCAAKPVQKRTEPPEVEYAKDTQSEILRIQALAKKNLPEARREVDVLVENFQGYEDEPLGDQKATYDAIVKGLQELQAMMGARASKQQVLAKFDEIAQLARRLSTDAP